MDAYSTNTLLDMIRELDPFEPFLLNMLCPSKIEFGTEKISFDDLDADFQLAPFVSPMVAGRARADRGSTLKEFAPAYVKPKDVVRPDRLLKRAPGEPLAGNLSPAQRRAMVVAQLLEEHRRQIRRREEWMVSQILQTGKVTVSGPDYPEVEVDFGRRANLTVALTTTAWDQAGSDPLADLEDYFTRLDAPCTDMIFGRVAGNAFLRHDEVKDAIDTRRGSDTQFEIAPIGELNAQYRGRLGASGPRIWTYYGFYETAGGTKTMFMPDEGMALVSAGKGVRCYGAIQDSKAIEDGVVASEAWPKNWHTEDPAVENLMTQSAPLPVIPRINSTMYVDVING